LGVGTTEGAPIPQRQGGFLKDASGAIVIPKLREAALREVAQGGIYQRIQANDSDVKALLSLFEQDVLKNKEANQNDLQIDTWREQGPWLLLLVLPLAALTFRRGYLVWLFLLLTPIPSPAWEWDDLWFTRDQQASQAYTKEDLQQAAELFDDPAWKATSQYKAGQYEQALESLSGLEGADNLYNKGNALANLGRYPEAVAAYKQALEMEPEHDDAKHNKELVEKQLKEEEQNSQSQEGKNQDSQEQSSKSDSQNQEGQNKDSKEQEGQDSQQSQEGQDSKSGEKSENSQASKPEDSKLQPSEEASMPKDSEKQSDEKGQAATQMDTPDEMQQAHEQLLRKIPDDPGGLLRRKFKYQYQQDKQKSSQEEQPW